MRVRGLLENSLFALLGEASSKGSVALIMAIAARALSIGSFALLAAALAAASILSASLDLGAQTLITRDGAASPEGRATLLRSLLVGRGALCAVALCGALVAGLALGQVGVALLTVAVGAGAALQLLLTGALRSAQDLALEAALKVGTAALAVALGLVCLLDPSPEAFLAALALATIVLLVPTWALVRRVLGRAQPASAWRAARRAAPLGLMTLATLGYYRSGAIVLKLDSTSAATSHFAAASALAFGTLMVTNAITTSLLPRLSATQVAARAALVRRAGLYALGAGLAVALLVAALARPILDLAFGPGYGAGAPALRVLMVATVLIGPSGVLGTALVTRGHLRPLYIQIGFSLAINLTLLALLGGPMGAMGGAIATLSCEGFAFLFLLVACRQDFLGERDRVIEKPDTEAPGVSP
jgi:O-antigen/teichoic acid export membrane protein